MEFNTIYKGLISGTEKLALVGLGYVGMPIAVEFAKHVKVIGFDINEQRVNEYKNGINSIAIPTDTPVPDWIVPFINYSEIIHNNLNNFTLESIGIHRFGNKNITYSNILEL